MKIPTFYQATHLEEKDINFKYLYTGYVFLILGIIYCIYFGWINFIIVGIIFSILMFNAVRWY